MRELFIVTGASGWLGRNYLHYLQEKIPRDEYNEKVFAYGSSKKIISSTAYGSNQEINIEIRPLKDLKKKFLNCPNLNIIHTAFITREKISSFGLKNYIYLNKEISITIKDLIKSSKGCKCIITSSGAANIAEQNKKDNSFIENNPYAYLKLYEENLLKDLAPCLILRIYALLGRFIQKPKKFAIGNFLLNAKKKENITIKSKNRVFRSYVHTKEIVDLSLNWLKTNDEKISYKLNAASNTYDLFELGSRIKAMYLLNKINHSIDNNLPFNNYTCDTNKFKKILKKYNVTSKSFEEQIKDTMTDI